MSMTFESLPNTSEHWAKLSGTHLVGEVHMRYADLVGIFGEPATGDGHKTDVEWLLEFADGTVATIYNYKDGKAYLGHEGRPVEDITHWHVGGHDRCAFGRVVDVVAERAA